MSMKCERCGGTIVRTFNEYSCINCGRKPNKEQLASYYLKMANKQRKNELQRASIS